MIDSDIDGFRENVRFTKAVLGLIMKRMMTISAILKLKSIIVDLGVGHSSVKIIKHNNSEIASLAIQNPRLFFLIRA